VFAIPRKNFSFERSEAFGPRRGCYRPAMTPSQSPPTGRRIVVFTGGLTHPHVAKTAISVIRYRGDDVVAVLDAPHAGRTAGEVLGVGNGIPVVASLAEAPTATELLVGIAPPGGELPPEFRAVIAEAIARGLDVVSGLHTFLGDDPEFAAAATARGVRLFDVRRNQEREVAQRKGLRAECLRLHTVGTDCAVGKMVASIEIVRSLVRRGIDARFVATGQTGIMIEGEGCPIDCVVSDFVNGAAERLVLANQHHDVIAIEGQGSIFHPRYSSVTYGLLHGSLPDCLVLCHEIGRREVWGLEGIPLPSLARAVEAFEAAANLMHPCRVVGVALNGRTASDAELEAERRRVRDELGLPACDVFRHGADELAEAVLAHGRSIGKEPPSA
jgi:uncharacterized NAD-dependent epimerase/dehydratase family protein